MARPSTVSAFVAFASAALLTPAGVRGQTPQPLCNPFQYFEYTCGGGCAPYNLPTWHWKWYWCANDSPSDGVDWCTINGAPCTGKSEPTPDGPSSCPDIPEICGDGIDNNCDGNVDENCQKDRCEEAVGTDPIILGSR